jgi:iron complex outermembrane receptor protein
LPPESDAGSIEQSDADVVKVTVDRREKRLQDYAGAATVMRQEDLDRTGVNNVTNMSGTTPFVEIGQQENNVEIYIRGIGSNNNTELGDPAASTHIDGVYIARPRGVGAMLFDLERVELNRGPQGTVRGRNATAGSLNIITAKPVLGEWDANASLQMGNYSSREARAMLSIPFGDKLALRLAAVSLTHSPFYKNAGPIRQLSASESADTLAYRATLLWKPVNALTVTIRHDYMQEGGTGSTGSNYNGALVAGLLPQEVPDPRAVVYRTPQGVLDSKNWGFSGNIVGDLGPVQVEYLGGYRDLNYIQTDSGQAGIDYPGRVDYQLDNASTTYWHQHSKSVVQELRFYSPDTARFRWTVGGFFFNEEQKAFFATTADQSNGFAGVEFTMPKMHSQSWAGFADGIFDIVKTLRATGGVRITTEEKQRDGIGNVYSWSGIPNNFRFGTDGFAYADQGRTLYSVPPVVGGVQGTQSPPPFDIFRNGVKRFGARDTISDALNQPGVAWTGSANEQHGKYDDKFVDFRVGLDADIAKDHLVYAMFSTGHKSGGFNDNFTYPGTNTSIALTYKPESVYSTEIGTKNEFLNRNLMLNVSAFWYSYLDLQLQQIVQLTPPSGDPNATTAAAAVRSNAASSRVLGVEMEGAARLPAGFLARASALLLDARFSEGVIADTRVGFGAGDQLPTNIKDNFLPRSPVLSVNYSLAQTIQTAVGYFDWIVSAQTKTKQYMTPFNGDGVDSRTGATSPNLSDVVPSYTRIDVGAGFTHPNGKLRFDGYINNLTDEAHVNSIINTPSLNLRFFNPPRQMGVRLSVFL